MTIQYIPEELNEQILLWVRNDKAAIFNCALVCKAWYKLAIKLYYETLLLSGDMNIWLNTIKENAVNGIWVKRLIAANESNVLTKEQYDDMLSCFPNLTEIDIQKSSWSHYFHLARLTGRDKSRPLRLRNIVVKTENMTKREYQRYYICAYSFRESLRHLQLTYINNGTYIFNNQTGNLLYHLKDFRSITHLTLNNIENQYGYRNMKIIPIIELFPHLVNFSMVTDYNEPKSFNYTKQTPVIENTCQHLKYFSLKSPTILESHLIYFTKFFPDNMRILNLHLTNTNMIQLFQSINKNVLERFGGYLSNHVDEYCIEINNNSNTTKTNEVIISSVPIVEDVMDSYWSFVDSLRGKQHYSHIAVSIIDQDQSKLGFKIVKNQKSMSLFYELIAEDIARKLTTAKGQQQAIHAIISPQLHKEDVIRSIFIHDIEHSVMESGLSLTLLESIVKVYKKDLEIVMMSWNNDKEIGPQLLVFGGSSIRQNPFFANFAKRIFDLDHQHITPQSPLDTVGLMTCGLIKGKRLDKKYLDTIFTILPNLTSLKLIRCLITDKMEEQQPSHFLLNVEHNQKLNYLLLDVALFVMDYLAIKVEYTNTTNKTVIYEWKRTVYTMNPRKLIGDGFKETSLEAVDRRIKSDPNGSKIIHIRCYNVEQIDIAIMDETVALSILQNNDK